LSPSFRQLLLCNYFRNQEMQIWWTAMKETVNELNANKVTQLGLDSSEAPSTDGGVRVLADNRNDDGVGTGVSLWAAAATRLFPSTEM